MSVPSPKSRGYFPCKFLASSDVIAAEVIKRQCVTAPELMHRYGAAGLEKCRADVRYHLLYLAEAVAARSPALFDNYVAWLKGLLLSLGVPSEDISGHFAILVKVLEEFDNSDEARLAADYLNATLQALARMPSQPETHFQTDNKWSMLTDELLGALLGCQRPQAMALVDNAVANGATVSELYLEVFQPLLREVGRLWQINQLSVAQEHYCTAAVQLLMGRLSANIFDTKRIGRTVVAACVGNELHEIGLHMVTDFFEMDGWDSHFLGANVPTKALLSMMIEIKSDVLCLSATLTSHISMVDHIIREIRSEVALNNLKILVGGYPFNVQTDLWKRLGADGCAQDARAAIELCNTWNKV